MKKKYSRTNIDEYMKVALSYSMHYLRRTTHNHICYFMIIVLLKRNIDNTGNVFLVN
jgi:hypothetical protein